MVVTTGSGAAVPRGRASQCAQLDELLEGALNGRSGVLVLTGDAGVGKTALVEYAVASASGLRVVRVAGIEAELELAFAGLQQLCTPMLDGLERVPDPQREALETTFGLSAGPVPDRFLIGLAVLSLLSEVAEEQPLLCVIDDLQWLDRATAQALAFVAPRLLAEPVVLLLAGRGSSDVLAGLPELVVHRLGDADARDLLASVVPGRLDELVAARIVAETRGNPLALLELPQGLSAAQLAGGFGLLGAISLSGRIEESFLKRQKALPANTERLLLLAAAEPTGDPEVLGRAAERLGIDRSALEPAEAAGLIDLFGGVRFRHPLVRSAVYRAATPQQRREVHRALAQATDARADPDRRAWHLAEAAARPNEAVAAELERAADRAQARGGAAAAAAFLERAAALTPEPALRAPRALAAAESKYGAGALDEALALLTAAEAGTLDDLSRARGHLLRAQIAFASHRGSDAPPLLLRAAREFEPIDPTLTRTTYLDALTAARFAGPLAHAADVVAVSEAALAGVPLPRRPRPPDLLLQGLALQSVEGYGVGAPILKQALRAFRDEPELPPHEARWLTLACWAAADLWDDDTWALLAKRELTRARDAGVLTALPLALSMLSFIHAVSGELDRAEALLDELRVTTEATGMPSHPYVALWVAGLRGREVEVSHLIETITSDALARGEGFALYVTAHVSAVLNNALGRYEQAVDALRRQAVDPASSDGSPRPMAELIEAAVRSGDSPLAQRALERLAMTTQATGTNWGLGVEAVSRALLSHGEAADRHYREGIERLRRTCRRVTFARAHLLYGEWLRRERRRADAREHLRTALEMFTGMGADAFAARAERELLATGEQVRKRTMETRDELTSREAQIARLASEGLSNPEIGARLFISQTTVAYHLRHVFSKLNIASRHQLAQALPDRHAGLGSF
jgi:DNA-binding CsgD family transcriptional regulator